jgi:membrane carboxypeptidase/penicillin-binding protein PbpC
VQFFLKTLAKVGLEIGSKEDLGLASVLGAGEVSLLDLTTAFTVFPRKGFLENPKFILQITDENGEILKTDKDLFPRKENKISRIFSLNTAEWIIDALSDKIARWRNFSRGNILEVDRPVAVKTGTSQEFKDNWVVGFSRDLAIGVWVGNARGAPLHTSSGVEGAGLIWNKVFRFLHKDLPIRDFEFIGERRKINICRRPYEQDNCSEKVNEFLTPTEITNLRVLNSPEVEISFPHNGDVFHQNSEILLQVRNLDFAESREKIKYFLNSHLTTNHIKNLSIGRYEIFAEFEKNNQSKRTKSVFITVE